jgi:hypothetical protein
MRTPEEKAKRAAYMRGYNKRPASHAKKLDYDRRWTAENRSRKNDWDREYRKRNQGVINAKNRLRRKLDAVKVHARDAVTNAVRAGRLMKCPCARCGEVKAEAHHPDYSKPLDVIWLCDICHGLEHRMEH